MRLNSRTASRIAVNLLHVGSTTPSAGLLLSIARQQGIFARYGLQVRMVFVPGTEIPRLTAEIPFGVIGAPAAILRASDGVQLKILGCLNSGRSSGRLIASPAITKRAGLSGARVGVRALGAGQWIQTLVALEYLGLDLQRDRIVPLPIGDESRITSALETGDIDAAIFSATQAHLLKARGFYELLDLYPADICGFPSAVAVTVDHLQRFPDQAEKLMAALTESMAFCLAPPNEAVVTHALMQAFDTTDLAAGQEGYREFLLTAMLKPYPCTERLMQMQKMMARHDPKVLDVRVEDLIDDRFIRPLEGEQCDRSALSSGLLGVR